MNVNQSVEERVVLRRAEVIDAQSINQYVQEQGYVALQKAIKSMSPQEVIEEIKNVIYSHRYEQEYLLQRKNVWYLPRSYK